MCPLSERPHTPSPGVFIYAGLFWKLQGAMTGITVRHHTLCTNKNDNNGVIFHAMGAKQSERETGEEDVNEHFFFHSRHIDMSPKGKIM